MITSGIGQWRWHNAIHQAKIRQRHHGHRSALLDRRGKIVELGQFVGSTGVRVQKTDQLQYRSRDFSVPTAVVEEISPCNGRRRKRPYPSGQRRWVWFWCTYDIMMIISDNRKRPIMTFAYQMSSELNAKGNGCELKIKISWFL